MCLERSLEGNDKSLEGHGGLSGGVPILYEGRRRLCDTGAGGYRLSAQRRHGTTSRRSTSSLTASSKTV
jgi:hypothetical protein